MAPLEILNQQQVLIDWWRRDQNDAGIMSGNRWMSNDLLDILRVLFQRDVLINVLSAVPWWESCVVRTKEDDLNRSVSRKATLYLLCHTKKRIRTVSGDGKMLVRTSSACRVL